MDMGIWQDDVSLELRAVLDAQPDPIPFEAVKVSRAAALLSRVAQKAKRVISTIARRS